MSDFVPLDFQSFLIEIPSTNKATKISCILSEMFTTAYVVGIIKINPYQGIKIKRYKTPKPQAMTHKEQLILLNFVDKIYSNTIIPDLIRTLLMTGLRQGELVALPAKNVDIDNQELKITCAFKARDKTIGKPKTEQSIRTIPIAKPLIDILKPYVDKCKNIEERIFNLDNITYRLLSSVIKQANLAYTGHITRHTFITNAFEIGIPQYLVQQWVGHTEQLQTQAYLGLRRAKDFLETEITQYMRLLKEQVIVK